MTATLPRYMKPTAASSGRDRRCPIPSQRFHNYEDDVNVSDKVHDGESKVQKGHEPERKTKKESADEKVAVTYEQKVNSPLGGTVNDLETTTSVSVRAFKGNTKVPTAAGDVVGDGGNGAAVRGVEMLKQKPDVAKLRASFARVVSALVDLAHYLAFWKNE